MPSSETGDRERGEVTPGELGEESGVVCDNCGEASYRRILGLSEDTEYVGGIQHSCPNCGDGRYLDTGRGRYDEDVEECEECGEEVDFRDASAYYKTADERFWHEDCHDPTEKLDRIEEIRHDLIRQIIPEDCFDGLSDDFYYCLDSIQDDLDEAVRKERLRQEQDLVNSGGRVRNGRSLHTGKERTLDLNLGESVYLGEESETKLTRVYADEYRLERDGQGMFKLSGEEIEHLTRYVHTDNEHEEK